MWILDQGDYYIFNSQTKCLLATPVHRVRSGRLGVDESYLSSGLSPHGEAEQSGLLRVALHLELGEAGGVAFDGLGHLPVHRVQLHGAHHTVLLEQRREGKELESSALRFLNCSTKPLIQRLFDDMLASTMIIKCMHPVYILTT